MSNQFSRNSTQQYEKYKDSGIAWIGEIPEHWEVKRAKNLFKKEKREVSPSDEVITCFRDGIVTLRKNKRLSGFTESLLEQGYQGVKKGDLVIHQMDAFAGAIGVSDSNGKATSVYHCCTPINYDIIVYYFSYLLRCMALSGFIQALYRGIRERSSDFNFITFRKQLLLLPPLSEQKQIADYLDKKCALIDESIEKQKTSIEKLKEYKQAIITEAATKGLNKSAPLKNSNIEWIGQIPEHWEVKKLKFVTLCNQKTLSEDTNPEQEINYIEIGSVTNENGIETFETMSFENAPSRARRIVNFGDTILSTVRTYLKAIAYIDNSYDKFICSTGFAVFTPKDEIINKFLFYCLHSEWFISSVEANSVGISYPAINTTNLINFKILLPPLSEQEEIAAYLDKKCAEIDTAIQGKEKLIEKLTEYKKSLIFECVTGKRKVAAC